jgi:hypothetical protein
VPGLLRDLAAEVGPRSPGALQAALETIGVSPVEAKRVPPPDTSATYHIIMRYHTSRAYIHQGERTEQRGDVHIHVAMGPATFTSVRRRTITRWVARACVCAAAG